MTATSEISLPTKLVGGPSLPQERRLVTAALELVLDSPELHKQWLSRVNDVVRRDIDKRSPAIG